MMKGTFYSFPGAVDGAPMSLGPARQTNSERTRLLGRGGVRGRRDGEARFTPGASLRRNHALLHIRVVGASQSRRMGHWFVQERNAGRVRSMCDVSPRQMRTM